MSEPKAKILVVEDEPHLLLGIKEILQLDGYEVETAKNGQEGLDKLQDSKHLPDLIISDIMMPIMTGHEFLQHVHKELRWQDIPFVFLTALGKKQDKRLGYKLGVDVYITKPFDSDDLLTQVANKIERSRAIKAKYEDATEIIKTRLKTQLTSMFNHEVRTPTMIISGFVDLLKDNMGSVDQMSADEVMLFLREITYAADRLGRLMDNFIAYAEIDSGEVSRTYELRKTVIEDYHSIVYVACNDVLDRSREVYHIDFTVKENAPAIVGDETYLTAVIRELLSNAVKFSNPSSDIETDAIRLIVDGYNDQLRIVVEDLGRGIPEEEFSKIWEPILPN